MRWICLIILVAVSAARATAPWEGEQVTQWTDARDVQILINAPERIDPAKKTWLIVFALPNGNTIEQTMGSKLAPGMHWRYDIQHVAAQVRKLRQIDSDENIIVACAEAKGLSWPSWKKQRQDGPKVIREIVQNIVDRCPAKPSHITLTGHSGGGSFIFGYIDGRETIADNIDRIAPLDANYSFDAEQHAGKLLKWLKSQPTHRLVIIAYDDREITVNGKKVVSDTGGTYRASHRIIDAMANDLELKDVSQPPFEHFVGMNG